MKNLLRTLILAIFAAAPLLVAAEANQQLVITLTNQTRQTFLLSSQPVVKFGTTDLTVQAGETTYSVERNQVKTFTFEEASTEGVHTVGAIIPSQGENAIYDMSGKLLQKGEVNVSTLPAGNYILKNGQQSVKILKH